MTWLMTVSQQPVCDGLMLACYLSKGKVKGHGRVMVNVSKVARIRYIILRKGLPATSSPFSLFPSPTTASGDSEVTIRFDRLAKVDMGSS
jgi:hypothetical protein